MANFSQVLKDFFRVILFEKLGDLRVLEAARPRHLRHNLAVTRGTTRLCRGPPVLYGATPTSFVVSNTTSHRPVHFQLRITSAGRGLLMTFNPNLRQLAVLCQSITLRVGCLACRVFKQVTFKNVFIL